MQCAYFFGKKKAMYVNFYTLFPRGMSIPIGSSKLGLDGQLAWMASWPGWPAGLGFASLLL